MKHEHESLELERGEVETFVSASYELLKWRILEGCGHDDVAELLNNVGMWLQKWHDKVERWKACRPRVLPTLKR